MALHSLSFCTGLGGLDLAVELACPGLFRPVLYCERELSVAEVLAARIEEGALPAAPIWSDVKTVCSKEVRAYLRARAGGAGIGLLTAGYPCQPFSCAGKRRGRDDPRHLWPWIADAIDCFEPGICFFENVPGHLILGFAEVRRNLEERGYRVEAGLFSAEEVGAPHKRLRLFIVAVADTASIGARSGEGDARSRRNGVRMEGRESRGDSDDGSAGVAHASCQRRPEDARGPSGDEAADGRTGRDGSEQDGDHVVERARAAVVYSRRNGRRLSLAGQRAEGRTAIGRTSEQFPNRCVECGKRHSTGSMWCGFECAAVWIAANASPEEIAEFRNRGTVGNAASGTGDMAAGHSANGSGREQVAGDGHCELADAPERGRGELRESSRGDGQPDRRDEELAHTERDRRPEYGARTGANVKSDNANGCGAIPNWPPARNDFDQWRRILAEYPWLAPAVTETEAQSRFRGMADGIPDGLERMLVQQWNARLRSLGNGIVVETAAAAFVCLLAAACSE